MANESVLIFETETAVPFTCADGAGIEKGALLQLTDPMTASLASAANQMVAGIAAEEKIASDGKTKIAVYRGGIFKVIASGSIAVGDELGFANYSDNRVYSNRAAANVSGSTIVGTALETATVGESFLMELKPQGALHSF
jgi:hypothetical protein